MFFVLIIAFLGFCSGYQQQAGHYYDLQPVRRHFNIQIPEPIANAHPHDEAAIVQQHPIHGTYTWKDPNSANSNNPNRKGIDYVFGLQRWAKVPK